jgi:hypothetical protein
MATFQAQVEGLTSLSIGTTPTTAELTQFLTDGAREIISILPADLLQYCTGSTRLDSSQVTWPLSSDIDMGKILYVTRYDGARERPCRLIAGSKKGLALDSSDIVNYAPYTDPAYCLTSSTGGSDNVTDPLSIIQIFPEPDDTQYGVIYHVSYPAVAFNASSITNFPDSAEHLVVLYASLKTVLAKIGSLEISPNVSDDTAGDNETLTSDMDSITSGQIGTDTDFDDFNKWFVALGEMIEDDEDIELAGAQIEKINSYVNTWNIQLQGNLAEMQRYMGIYQGLKADYAQGMAMLTGATQQPAQQASAKR